jgi:hypothetical protein
MKKVVMLAAFMILVALPVVTMAVVTTEFTYSPDPANMDNLDHWKAYEWKIDLTSEGYTIGTPITEATLTFHNINNWDDNANVLYIRLLNSASGNTLIVNTDNQNPSDYFAGYGGVLIDSWVDSDGYPGPAEDLVYTFSTYDPPGHEDLLTALNNYASDGYIAFGIDPDCHYWNCGVEFKINTSVIPAPGAVFLGGIGIALVGWLRSRQMF